MSQDTYTVAEAARLLEVTPKRVRQMIAEGKLAAVAKSSPVRLTARSVLAERKRRGDRKPQTAATGSGALVPLSEVAALIEQAREAAERAAQRQLEAREAVEATLRESLAEARAQAWDAQQKLEAAIERAAAAEARADTRRLWRR